MQTVKTNVPAVKKSEKLKNVNVSDIKKKVQASVETKKPEDVKVIKDKIYAFDYQTLSTDSLKSKRQTARKRLSAFVRDIINYSDLQKDSDKLAIKIKEFIIFYKETYVKNDFSIGSLRNKMEELEKRDLTRMLSIIQDSKK